ncbi:hypothetical protein [Massilia sp. ZL223]|uniref:hypothetical protein n=1 Tax=Massilia sp. ZL223 TaxID=2824904 RepID=UPI001B82D8D5|nr:hypothetical protein [Massilia sp. ZL223]MBQ5963175.1 hypothetical protein [Massilia sp. ZL223]
MSEEDQLLGGKPMVTFSDAVEFFKKRATNPCPTCSSKSWAVTTTFGAEPKMGWGFAAVNLRTGISISRGIPVIYAQCKKCAYLRVHDLTAISTWVEQGKPEYKEDE